MYVFMYVGAFFIDCSPECFDRILDFHATGRLTLTGLNKAQRDILTHTLKHLCIEDVFAGSIMHPPHSGNFDIETLNNSNNTNSSGTNSTTTASATVFSDRIQSMATRYNNNISPELQSLVDLAKEVELKLKRVEEVEKLWIRSEEAVIACVCMYACMYVPSLIKTIIICMYMYVCICICMYANVNLCFHMYVCICMYVCMYAYVYM